MRNLQKHSFRFGQRGVSMMETLLVLPIMLLIGFGIVHGGLVYQAQANLEYAALMAARVGAASNIDIDAMKSEVEYRMRATSGVSGDVPAEVGQQLDKISIEVLNPSLDMFLSCGGQPALVDGCAAGYDNQCEIPYFGQQFIARTTACAGASIQDANILRIRVVYTYNSSVPFLSRIHFVGENVRPTDDEGIGVTAIATVRMQSPARLSDGLLESYTSASSMN